MKNMTEREKLVFTGGMRIICYSHSFPRTKSAKTRYRLLNDFYISYLFYCNSLFLIQFREFKIKIKSVVYNPQGSYISQLGSATNQEDGNMLG